LNKSFKSAVEDLVQSSQIPKSLEHANSFKMQTQTAVKQVLIDDLLYRYLPLQKITAGSSSKLAQTELISNERNKSDTSTYQVARVKAVIKVASTAHREPGTLAANAAQSD